MKRGCIMKAVVVETPGDINQLRYMEVSRPKVKPGWSLIKVKGFGINHSEIVTRQGLSPSVKFPRILGIECVGEISISTDSDRIPVGQKVVSLMGEMGRAFDGSYAEYTLVPNKQIYPIKTSLDWISLATLPESYYTAYGSLLNLRIVADETILVRGGSSGVGLAFVNLVKAKFPTCILTAATRNITKKRSLLDYGYDHIVLDINNSLQTNDRYSKVLELVGPKTIKDTFKHVQAGGIVCSTGQLGGQWSLENIDPIIDFATNSYLTSFYSNNVSENILNNLLEYINTYNIKIRPEKIFKLSELQQAHNFLESSQNLGKVIVLNN